MGGGIGLVFQIAKDALAAQQYGIAVAGHNIANVNTPGYSKQNAVFGAREPAPFGGFYLGRGVDTIEISRASDQLVENRVMQQKSDLHAYKEMENYMLTMEGLFNENSGSSMSTLLGEYWNLWHDVSNDPFGTSERIALYEHSELLADQFRSLDTDLLQLSTDLTNAMGAGIDRLNEITSEIAAINGEIVGTDTIASANDLKDQRNELASELSEYIDIKIFEQSDGTFSIISQSRGIVLVEGNSSYDLELDGTAVKWQGSGTNEVDITDDITKGKLAGWLEMRDEIVAKTRQDLTEFTSEFIWMVNEQHSQGIGKSTFSSLTGSYAATDSSAAVSSSSSGLDYYDKISSGTFRVYVYDSTGALANAADITVTAGATTLDGIATAITAVDGDITATVNGNGQLAISTTNSHTFAFSNDTSHALAALGVNTFFTGATAGGIGINSVISGNQDYIAAAQISNTTTGDFGTGDNTNALAVLDKQYTSANILRWTYDRLNGNSSNTVSGTIEDYYHSMVGSLGIESSRITRSSKFHASMVQELFTLRESISSVSLDEEMTDIIQFQHAYSAAAKLISASDEMLRDLLATK